MYEWLRSNCKRDRPYINKTRSVPVAYCDGDRERVPNSQTREWTTIFPRNTPTAFHKTVIMYFFLTLRSAPLLHTPPYAPVFPPYAHVSHDSILWHSFCISLRKWFLKTNCQTLFKAKYWIIFFVTFRHMGKLAINTRCFACRLMSYGVMHDIPVKFQLCILKLRRHAEWTFFEWLTLYSRLIWRTVE